MPIVWEIYSVPFETKTKVFGVLLKAKPYSYLSNPKNRNHLSKILGSYFYKPLKNKPVKIVLGQYEFDSKTNSRGEFSLTADLNSNESPQVFDELGKKLEIVQNSTVVISETDSGLNVVSDIDDTLISSHSNNLIRRIFTLIALSATRRKTVGYSKLLLRKFSGLNARFFYLSRSESNLVGLLHRIFELNRLPEGAFLLTPFQNIKHLFFNSGKHNHKLIHLRNLLQLTQNQSFVLIGDDTQKDIEIYDHVVNNYPGRIAKVYIHKTRNKLSGNRKKSMENLLSSSVPIKYFKKDELLMEEGNFFETLI